MARLAKSDFRGRGAPGHSRFVSALLVLVNMVLAAYAGAALLTAVRLRWDPTTYLLAERIFPTKFEELARKLPVGGASLLLLTHVAVMALYMRGWCRRILLFLYAVLMLAMVAMEAVAARWTAAEARQQLEAAQGHVQSLLMYTAKVKEQLPAAQILDIPNIVDNVVQGGQNIIQGGQNVIQGAQNAIQGGQGAVQGAIQGGQDAVQGAIQGAQDAVQGGLPGGLPSSFPHAVKNLGRVQVNLLDFMNKFQRIVTEIEKDIPFNVTVASNAAIGLAVLQVIAAALALLAALGDPVRPAPRAQLLEPQ